MRDWSDSLFAQQQNHRMMAEYLRPSLLMQLFPPPPAKPLTVSEKCWRAVRIRANRLRDALKVLRGEAEIEQE